MAASAPQPWGATASVTIGAVSSEAVWNVPEPLSVHEVPVDGGARVVLRRHGNPNGARLVLSHGVGLSIDLYYPFWSRLTDDFDVVVYDLRSHGWNPVGPLAGHTVPDLVSDHELVLDAIDGRYGPKPQAGVFHSVSSLAPLLSPTEGGRFDALVLFDPLMRKPGSARTPFDEAADRAAGIAERRAFRFATREDFADRLRSLAKFEHAVAGMCDLMALTTLRASADGSGYELRCPREHEARIIAYARIYAVLVDLESLACPTKVIGGDPVMPYTYLPPLDLREMVTVDYDFLPDTTHFLQLEQPAECAAAARGFLARVGLA